MKRFHQQRAVRAITGILLAALSADPAPAADPEKPVAPAAQPELVPDPAKRLIPPPPIPVTKDSPNSESPTGTTGPQPKTPAPVIKDTGAPALPPPPVPQISSPPATLTPEWPVRKPAAPAPPAAAPKDAAAPLAQPKKATPRPPAGADIAKPKKSPVPASASPPARAETTVAKPPATSSRSDEAPKKVARKAATPSASANPVADKSPASEPKKAPGFFALLLSKLRIADRPSQSASGKEVAPERETGKPESEAPPVSGASPVRPATYATVSEEGGTFLYRFHEGSMIQMRLGHGEVLEVTGTAAEGERRPVRTVRGQRGYVNSAALRPARAGESAGFMAAAPASEG